MADVTYASHMAEENAIIGSIKADTRKRGKWLYVGESLPAGDEPAVDRARKFMEDLRPDHEKKPKRVLPPGTPVYRKHVYAPESRWERIKRYFSGKERVIERTLYAVWAAGVSAPVDQLPNGTDWVDVTHESAETPEPPPS